MSSLFHSKSLGLLTGYILALFSRSVLSVRKSVCLGIGIPFLFILLVAFALNLASLVRVIHAPLPSSQTSGLAIRSISDSGVRNNLVSVGESPCVVGQSNFLSVLVLGPSVGLHHFGANDRVFFSFQATGFAASVSPSLLKSCVFWCELVTPLAMSFSGVDGADPNTPKEVFPWVNNLKMLRIAARKVSAEVVGMRAFWDGALRQKDGQSMSVFPFSISSYLAISPCVDVGKDPASAIACLLHDAHRLEFIDGDIVFHGRNVETYRLQQHL